MLKGLLTVKDIQKARDYPNAATELAETSPRRRGGRRRQRSRNPVDLMVRAGVDAITIDTAHGHSKGVLEAVQRIKSAWKDLPVFAGNVVTAEGAEALIRSGR